jgi:hypothetical protein
MKRASFTVEIDAGRAFFSLFKTSSSVVPHLSLMAFVLRILGGILKHNAFRTAAELEAMHPTSGWTSRIPARTTKLTGELKPRRSWWNQPAMFSEEEELAKRTVKHS